MLVIDLAKEVDWIAQELVVELIGKGSELLFELVEAVVVGVMAVLQPLLLQLSGQVDEEVTGYLVTIFMAHQHAFLLAQLLGDGLQFRLAAFRKQLLQPIACTSHLTTGIIEVLEK